MRMKKRRSGKNIENALKNKIDQSQNRIKITNDRLINQKRRQKIKHTIPIIVQDVCIYVCIYASI